MFHIYVDGRGGGGGWSELSRHKEASVLIENWLTVVSCDLKPWLAAH